jgi:hypothetical protein
MPVARRHSRAVAPVIRAKAVQVGDVQEPPDVDGIPTGSAVVPGVCLDSERPVDMGEMNDERWQLPPVGEYGGDRDRLRGMSERVRQASGFRGRDGTDLHVGAWAAPEGRQENVDGGSITVAKQPVSGHLAARWRQATD